MKIKNSEIEKFGKFLLSLELDFRQTRKCIQLIKILEGQLEYVQKSVQALIKLHVKHDEEGKPKTKQVQNQIVYDIENMDAYKKDELDLLNEEFVIDVNKKNKDMLEAVKDMVLNGVDPNRKFSNQDMIEYNRWCEIVETIEYEEPNESKENE